MIGRKWGWGVGGGVENGEKKLYDMKSPLFIKSYQPVSGWSGERNEGQWPCVIMTFHSSELVSASHTHKQKEKKGYDLVCGR